MYGNLDWNIDFSLDLTTVIVTELRHFKALKRKLSSKTIQLVEQEGATLGQRATSPRAGQLIGFELTQ